MFRALKFGWLSHTHTHTLMHTYVFNIDYGLMLLIELYLDNVIIYICITVILNMLHHGGSDTILQRTQAVWINVFIP